MSDPRSLALVNMEMRLSFEKTAYPLFIPIWFEFQTLKRVFVYFERGVYMSNFTSLTLVDIEVRSSYKRNITPILPF